MIYRRELSHVKLGRSVRIPEEAVARLIEENTVPARECRQPRWNAGGSR